MSLNARNGSAFLVKRGLSHSISFLDDRISILIEPTASTRVSRSSVWSISTLHHEGNFVCCLVDFSDASLGRDREWNRMFLAACHRQPVFKIELLRRIVAWRRKPGRSGLFPLIFAAGPNGVNSVFHDRTLRSPPCAQQFPAAKQLSQTSSSSSHTRVTTTFAPHAGSSFGSAPTGQPNACPMPSEQKAMMTF